MSEKVDFAFETIRRLHGVGSEYRIVAFDAHGKPEDFVEYSVALPVGKISKGKRKGRTKWPPKKDWKSFWIRQRDVKDTQKQFEETTGKCMECQGSCQEWAGWHYQKGHSYKPCTRCNATGSAPKPND